VKVTTAPEGPVASWIMLAGRVRAGGIVSWTVMWKDAEPMLPAASAALQLTRVVPRAKVLPEAGVQLKLTTLTASEAEVA